MQYLTGVVDVTNGSATVIGTNTLWLNQVETGNAFTVTGTGVFYDVASVQSDTELTLSTPYTGTTQTGVTYTIARDFTALNNIVEMKKGDIETAAIFTRAVRRIDQLLSLNQDAGALTSAGVYANTTDGLAGTTSGDYFFVPDGSEFVLYLNSSGSAVEQLRFASLATALQYASDAQQAASDAQTAQAAAETAESNAQTSETNAAASATAASNSESNALASENTASQQAGIATDAANDALSDADRAETARDAAQLSAGVYDDTTDGLNNTADGEYFSTPSANTDVYLILYRNDSGTATQIAEYPSINAVDSKLESTNNLSDVADIPTARTNLDVYSKSESVAASPVQSVDGKTGTVDLSADYEQKRQNNLSATTDPTVNDDSGAGYEPLSRWINTSTGEIWLCIDASVGAADWQQATLTIDELGALALANNASDVPYSNTTSGLTATEVQAALDEVDGNLDGHIGTGGTAEHPLATPTVAGFVEKATTADAEAGTADKFPDAAGVHAAFNQYGLGLPIDDTTARFSGDLNDLRISGFYYSVSATNTPTSENGFIIVYYGGGSPSVGCQEFTVAGGDASVPRKFTRKFLSGVWGAWQESFNQSNILGTVSQSGGVPTGAIIERGSNANGGYVKFADGALICTVEFTINVTSASINDYTWNYPVSFVGRPAVNWSNQKSNTYYVDGADDLIRSKCVTGHLNNGLSSAILRLYTISGQTITSGGSIQRNLAMAIGRWY